MAADSALGEVAALVVELRAIAESLRATAARMASVSAHRAAGGVSERELARRAKPELERAERRGIGGTAALDGRGAAGLGAVGSGGDGVDGRSGSWHRL